jgi:hypothetical protein
MRMTKQELTAYDMTGGNVADQSVAQLKAPLSVDGAQKLIERLGVAAKLPFPIHDTRPVCSAAGSHIRTDPFIV